MATGIEPGDWASPVRVAVVSIVAVNDVASAATPPTDRSKSPTTITIVWAAATMTRNETVSRMLMSRFSRLRNVRRIEQPEGRDDGEESDGADERPQAMRPRARGCRRRSVGHAARP